MTKKEVKIKADDFVEFEGLDQSKFTNFQELAMKVELLKENLDEITAILRENDVSRSKPIESPYFDDDEMYKRLEAE